MNLLEELKASSLRELDAVEQERGPVARQVCEDAIRGMREHIVSARCHVCAAWGMAQGMSPGLIANMNPCAVGQEFVTVSRAAARGLS